VAADSIPRLQRHLCPVQFLATGGGLVEVQLAYAIGVAEPVWVMVNTFGTGKIADEKFTDLVRENFQLTPRAIINTLKLRRPIYRKTAAFGHFGRTEDTFSWEATDKAAAIKEQAAVHATA
jgi:S-adenosylmethionine synthetase